MRFQPDMSPEQRAHRLPSLLSWLVTACVMLVPLVAQSQPSADAQAGHHAATPASSGADTGSAPASAALPEVAAEVRRIQADQGKITLRHAAIPNLDMAPMTMVFRVADTSWLTTFKPGDQVLFTVDQGPQGLTVRSLRGQP